MNTGKKLRMTGGALLLILAGWNSDALAQSAYRYRLFLTDKPEDSVVQLSQRSLDRRSRQEIALDDYDRCVSPTYLRTLQDSGLVVVTQSRWMNTVVVMRPNGKDIPASEWAKYPFIDRYTRVTSREQIKMPHDKNLSPKAVVPVKPDTPTRQLEEVKAKEMIQGTPWGEGMLITVVDGGFEGADTISSINHHLIGCYDPYRPADSTYLFNKETSYHGTHCWSIMACDGRDGFYGSAAKADYFLVRTEMDASETLLEEDMWIAGVELADSIGSDLVSSSLGYYEFDNSSFNHTQSQLGTGEVFVTQAAEIGCSRGMIICNAAGNEGGSSWNAIDFPADAEQVTTVGATDNELQPASFTSPGFLTPYVKPNVSCRGVKTYYIKPNGTIGTGNGTSYATPLMCGCMASLWSAVPSLSAQQIRDVVYQSASQYDHPDIRKGYGLPNFRVALQNALALANGEQGIANIMLDSTSANDVDLDLTGRPAPSYGLRIRNGKVIFIK